MGMWILGMFFVELSRSPRADMVLKHHVPKRRSPDLAWRDDPSCRAAVRGVDARLALPPKSAYRESVMAATALAARRRMTPQESRGAALKAARALLLESGPQAVTLKAVAEIGRASCRERVCQYV